MGQRIRNFFRGMGSVLNIMPARHPSPPSPSEHDELAGLREDWENLSRDWLNVSMDFRTAFDRVASHLNPHGEEQGRAGGPR